MAYCAVTIKQPPLLGTIEYHTGWGYDSHIVRVYLGEYDAETNWSPIYSASFGNYRMAEDRLVELLEKPGWTILKYT
jgi:hypothetical protein